MDELAAVASVVVHLMGPARVRPQGRRAAWARQVAAIVAFEAREHDVDPLLVAAVIARESGFRPGARSGAGDLGLMQVRRGVTTRGYDQLTDEQLMAPALNVHLGTRRLALARARCGGEPARWLGGYAGRPCGPSRYAARVLATRRGVGS